MLYSQTADFANILCVSSGDVFHHDRYRGKREDTVADMNN